MSSTFLWGGEKNFRGASPPKRPLVTGLLTEFQGTVVTISL